MLIHTWCGTFFIGNKSIHYKRKECGEKKQGNNIQECTRALDPLLHQLHNYITRATLEDNFSLPSLVKTSVIELKDLTSRWKKTLIEEITL